MDIRKVGFYVKNVVKIVSDKNSHDNRLLIKIWQEIRLLLVELRRNDIFAKDVPNWFQKKKKVEKNKK